MGESQREDKVGKRLKGKRGGSTNGQHTAEKNKKRQQEIGGVCRCRTAAGSRPLPAEYAREGCVSHDKKKRSSQGILRRADEWVKHDGAVDVSFKATLVVAVVLHPQNLCSRLSERSLWLTFNLSGLHGWRRRAESSGNHEMQGKQLHSRTS
ncbi:hypothetical protein L209DRAFT_298100 [Thermothelomyces heterothallicus CBS 203.75]